VFTASVIGTPGRPGAGLGLALRVGSRSSFSARPTRAEFRRDTFGCAGAEPGAVSLGASTSCSSAVRGSDLPVTGCTTPRRAERRSTRRPHVAVVASGVDACRRHVAALTPDSGHYPGNAAAPDLITTSPSAQQTGRIGMLRGSADPQHVEDVDAAPLFQDQVADQALAVRVWGVDAPRGADPFPRSSATTLALLALAEAFAVLEQNSCHRIRYRLSCSSLGDRLGILRQEGCARRLLGWGDETLSEGLGVECGEDPAQRLGQPWRVRPGHGRDRPFPGGVVSRGEARLSGRQIYRVGGRCLVKIATPIVACNTSFRRSAVHTDG
jgi:hypothetical protein